MVIYPAPRELGDVFVDYPARDVMGMQQKKWDARPVMSARHAEQSEHVQHAHHDIGGCTSYMLDLLGPTWL